jgi:hypothetical protein
MVALVGWVRIVALAPGIMAVSTFVVVIPLPRSDDEPPPRQAAILIGYGTASSPSVKPEGRAGGLHCGPKRRKGVEEGGHEHVARPTTHRVQVYLHQTRPSGSLRSAVADGSNVDVMRNIERKRTAS